MPQIIEKLASTSHLIPTLLIFFALLFTGQSLHIERRNLETNPLDMVLSNLGHQADPVLTRLVDEDKVPWYRKKNLRLLYLLLYPSLLGIEITSGYDSQLINGAQFIPSWNKCGPPETPNSHTDDFD